MDLAEYLESTNTSQAAFAEKMERHGPRVSQGTISNWVNGTVMVPVPAKLNQVIKASEGAVTKEAQRPDLYGN